MEVELQMFGLYFSGSKAVAFYLQYFAEVIVFGCNASNGLKDPVRRAVLAFEEALEEKRQGILEFEAAFKEIECYVTKVYGKASSNFYLSNTAIGAVFQWQGKELNEGQIRLAFQRNETGFIGVLVNYSYGRSNTLKSEFLQLPDAIIPERWQKLKCTMTPKIEALQTQISPQRLTG